MEKSLEQYSDVLTVQDVMGILKVGKNTVYKLLKTNQIEAVRIGKQYRIYKNNLINYLRNNGKSEMSCYNKHDVCCEYSQLYF